MVNHEQYKALVREVNQLLRNQKSIESSIKSIQSSVHELRYQIKTLENKFDSTNSKNDFLESSINSMKSEIDNLEKNVQSGINNLNEIDHVIPIGMPNFQLGPMENWMVFAPEIDENGIYWTKNKNDGCLYYLDLSKSSGWQKSG